MYIVMSTRVSLHYMRAPASLNENSTEKILLHFKAFQRSSIETEPIFTDFSANSSRILVEYSYLHIPCTHGCFV